MLTVQQAATRARRSRSTVELWIHDGLLDVTLVTTGRQKKRYVDEDQLMSVLRAKLDANPTRPRHAHDRTPLR